MESLSSGSFGFISCVKSLEEFGNSRRDVDGRWSEAKHPSVCFQADGIGGGGWGAGWCRGAALDSGLKLVAK